MNVYDLERPRKTRQSFDSFPFYIYIRVGAFQFKKFFFAERQIKFLESGVFQAEAVG